MEQMMFDFAKRPLLPYEDRQIESIGKQVMVDMAVEEDKEKLPF